MGNWTWEKVYQALVEKANSAPGKTWYKTPESQKKHYVCITPQRNGDTSMLLFSTVTGHYLKNKHFTYFLDPSGKVTKQSFNPELIENLRPCFGDISDEIIPHQRKYWHHCEIKNWNLFAEVLGLDSDVKESISTVEDEKGAEERVTGLEPMIQSSDNPATEDSNQALYLNGVFESVLKEILEAQAKSPELNCYLQPSSSGVIKFLADNTPNIENPIPLFLSISQEPGEVAYIAEIVGWEDKRNIPESRLNVINAQLDKYQPGEGGCFMEWDGKPCVNLISIINLQKLEQGFSVDNLIKVSDNTPHKIRTTSGGWSPVYSNPDLFKITKRDSSYRQTLEKQLQHDLQQEAFFEGGAKKETLVKIAKRNPKAREKCLESLGYDCQICGFSFSEYGAIGKDYIQVHHLELICDKDEEYEIDPEKDLLPVCANCHVMLHLKTPPYTPDELKDMMF